MNTSSVNPITAQDATVNSHLRYSTMFSGIMQPLVDRPPFTVSQSAPQSYHDRSSLYGQYPSPECLQAQYPSYGPSFPPNSNASQDESSRALMHGYSPYSRTTSHQGERPGAGLPPNSRETRTSPPTIQPSQTLLDPRLLHMSPDQTLSSTSEQPQRAYVPSVNRRAVKDPERQKKTRARLKRTSGVVVPSKLGEGEFPVPLQDHEEPRSRGQQCPICRSWFNRSDHVRTHFPLCVDTHGNPQGLRWDAAIDLSRRAPHREVRQIAPAPVVQDQRGQEQDPLLIQNANRDPFLVSSLRPIDGSIIEDEQGNLYEATSLRPAGAHYAGVSFQTFWDYDFTTGTRPRLDGN
ncbi:hypothetical protein ACLMJK_003729 [Lecanora helva]